MGESITGLPGMFHCDVSLRLYLLRTYRVLSVSRQEVASPDWTEPRQAGVVPPYYEKLTSPVYSLGLLKNTSFRHPLAL